MSYSFNSWIFRNSQAKSELSGEDKVNGRSRDLELMHRTINSITEYLKRIVVVIEHLYKAQVDEI